jgi:hypothetical protein
MECSIPPACNLTQSQINAISWAWDTVAFIADQRCDELSADARKRLLEVINELEHEFPKNHPVYPY